MNDSSIQSKEEDTESSQPNELVERLLRRKTEPIGVIDTLHPKRQYERTTELLARRFSFFDRWKSRYAVTDDTGGNANLVFNQAQSQQPRVMRMPDQSQQPRVMTTPAQSQHPHAITTPAQSQQPSVMTTPAQAQQPPVMRMPDQSQQPHVMTTPARSADQTFSETRSNQVEIPASNEVGLSRSVRPSITPQVSIAPASKSSAPAQFRVSRRRADASAPMPIAIRPAARSGGAVSEANSTDTVHNISSDRLSRSSENSLPQNIALNDVEQSHTGRSATGEVSGHVDLPVPEIRTSGVGIPAHSDSPPSSPAVSTQPSESLMKSDRASFPADEIRAGSISPLPIMRLQRQHDDKGARRAKSRELSNTPALPPISQVIQRASVSGTPNEQPTFSGSSESATFPKSVGPAEKRTALPGVVLPDHAGSSVGSADSFTEPLTLMESVATARPSIEQMAMESVETARPSIEQMAMESVETARPSIEQTGSDLPLSTPMIQRQSDAGSPANDTPSGSVSRAAETRAASRAEKTRMIWRQRDSESGKADTARNAPAITSNIGGVSLARQSESDTQPASSGALNNAAQPSASSADGADVARLAEQVWRLISRRLEVERERRGR